MPLKPRVALRIIQIIGIVTSIVSSGFCMVATFICITQFQNIFLDAADYVQEWRLQESVTSSVLLIKSSVYVTPPLMVISVLFGLASAVTMIIENRKLLLSALIACSIAAVLGIVFGSLCLISHTHIDILLEYVFKEGVLNYANFSNYKKTADLQQIVDSVQSEYECCGYESSNEYSSTFYNMVPPVDGDDEFYYVCLNRDSSPQQIPFSCCNKARDNRKLDFDCLINYFDWSSEEQYVNCTDAKSPAGGDKNKPKKGCKQALYKYSTDMISVSAFAIVGSVFMVTISVLNGILNYYLKIVEREKVKSLAKNLDLSEHEVKKLKHRAESSDRNKGPDSSTSKTDRPTDVSDFSISRRSAKERRSVKESPKSSVKQR